MPPGPVMPSSPRRGWNLGQSLNVLAAGATLLVVAVIAYGLWLCGRCWARNATSTPTEPGSDPPAAVAKPGLSKEAIAQIPITSFASMGHLLKEGSNECCAVCLGKFGEEDDKIRVLPNCSHCFHSECVDLWLYSHRTCPTCRSEFSGIGELAEPVEHIICTGTG